MHAFFMRHGEATTQAESDMARQLTLDGREDVVETIARCQQELTIVDDIWASPYVRAQQTAQLVSERIHKPVITQDFLTPTDNPDKILAALRNAEKTILIVSHQPLLGTLVDRLAGLETGRHRMGTSAIACIETDAMMYGCGDLLWLHQPE